MIQIIVVFAVAVVAVGVFVLGLSITRIRKGRDLESDIGSNRAMRRMGIECASAQIRREEAERTGRKDYAPTGCDGACGSCGVVERCGAEEPDSAGPSAARK